MQSGRSSHDNSSIAVQVVLLRQYEDRSVAGLSCSGQPVQKVRLDFGWEGALVGEGVEGVEMEWNALCYDITVCPAVLKQQSQQRQQRERGHVVYRWQVFRAIQHSRCSCSPWELLFANAHAFIDAVDPFMDACHGIALNNGLFFSIKHRRPKWFLLSLAPVV